MTEVRKRPVVLVDGRGQPTAHAKWKIRCGEKMNEVQCAYAIGHDGYHCDPTGRFTWEKESISD